MSVIDEIAAERRRHVEAEGWDSDHDDNHVDGSLAQAAAVYAFGATVGCAERSVMDEFGTTGTPHRIHSLWPASWSREWHKPKSRRRDLVRAAALIVAEIERLDRLDATPVTGQPEGTAQPEAGAGVAETGPRYPERLGDGRAGTAGAECSHPYVRFLGKGRAVCLVCEAEIKVPDAFA